MNRKNRSVVIIGASGFGKEVAWLAEQCNRDIRGFLDDGLENDVEIYGYRILGDIADYSKYVNCDFVVAIGNPRIRKNLVSVLKGVSFCTLVHPNVQMSKSTKIGDGTVVCAGSILTTDILIGDHCHVNLSCTIGHDSIIEDFCTLAPQAVISGNVIARKGVEIGTSAAIRQGVELGQGSMLGMGSVLTKNIPENQVFLGSPAKFFKEINEF